MVFVCQQLQDAYNRQKTNARTPDLVSEQEINDQPVKTTQSPNVTSTRRTTRSSKLADSADADGSVYGTPAKNSDDYNNFPEEDVSIPPAAKSKNVMNASAIDSPKPLNLKLPFTVGACAIPASQQPPTVLQCSSC
jgi:hypothetical protein